MAFSRPTLTEIIERIKGDFKTGLKLQTIIRRSFLGIFAKAFGGTSHTLHGHIDFALDKKFFLDTGDEETVIRWGTLFGLPRNEATFTQLTMRFAGTAGGTLIVGTVLVRSDGFEYILDAETIVPAAGTIDAQITASLEDTADLSGNMTNGDTLSLQSAVAGVDSSAEVIATITEGEVQEPIEDYRTRILERMQSPPSGGTVPDYIAYAKTVTSVTRVWVLPNNLGQGTVGTTFVEDGNAPASIIPSPGKVDEVQIAVDDLKPVTADHTAFAPIEFEMNPEIQLKPNTTAVQNAVIAELNDLLSREAEVRDAVDPDQVGLGVQFDGKIKLSQINEAISIADGEEDHVLISPTADVQPSTGGLVTLGTPVFSTLP